MAKELDKKLLVCVICGTPWEPGCKNVCEVCGGFCTWGSAKGAPPDSWIVTERGWVPRPPPKPLGFWRKLWNQFLKDVGR